MDPLAGIAALVVFAKLQLATLLIGGPRSFMRLHLLLHRSGIAAGIGAAEQVLAALLHGAPCQGRRCVLGTELRIVGAAEILAQARFTAF